MQGIFLYNSGKLAKHTWHNKPLLSALHVKRTSAEPRVLTIWKSQYYTSLSFERKKKIKLALFMQNFKSLNVYEPQVFNLSRRPSVIKRVKPTFSGQRAGSFA